MDKNSIVNLINALKILKEINLQQFGIITNFLTLGFNLTKEWLEFQRKIVKKLTNNVEELMKSVSNKSILDENFNKSEGDLKQLLKKNLEIDIKVQQILKEFQLNENDLSQKLLEFDYIVDQIKGSLN
ncbi:MAG: hypothetical protein ACFFDF_05300 [Candidatus Odinarchaeota archaeon]